jgi:hypothetical protein
VRRVLDEATSATPGALVEEKTATRAWHWRMAEPELGSQQAEALWVRLERETRGGGAEPNLRPTAPERRFEQQKQRDSAALQGGDRGHCVERIHGDPLRGEPGRHEGSAAPGELMDELRRAGELALSVDDAIRIAIRLALDAKDYDRAAALLDVLKSKGSGTSR